MRYCNGIRLHRTRLLPGLSCILSQRTWGLQLEEVIKHNVHTLFPSLHNDTDGIERRTAKFKEVVVSTDRRCLQNALEDIGKHHLVFSFRSHKGGVGLHLWRWECFAVDLAIGCHGHRVKLHISRRHHVTRQRH